VEDDPVGGAGVVDDLVDVGERVPSVHHCGKIEVCGEP